MPTKTNSAAMGYGIPKAWMRFGILKGKGYKETPIESHLVHPAWEKVLKDPGDLLHKPISMGRDVIERLKEILDKNHEIIVVDENTPEIPREAFLGTVEEIYDNFNKLDLIKEFIVFP